GIAASIKIATLPGEYRESKGLDVRDVLKLDDGEQLVRKSIESAEPFDPAGDVNAELEQQRQEKRAEAIKAQIALANAVDIYVGSGETEREFLTMTEILALSRRLSDNWPRRVGPVPFVVDNGEVQWLKGSSSIFGWAQTVMGPSQWSRGDKAVTKD